MGPDPVKKKLFNALILLAILYLFAIPFYMYAEGLGIVDAFYLTSVTITTVGYGDITPKTDIGKIFTVLLIFSGVSIFFYHVTHFGQFTERAIDPQVQRRLEMLRNLTTLHTGEVKKEELNKIKEKIGRKMQEKRVGE